MPFDIAHLMPAIEDLASYYASEVVPDLHNCSEAARALLQETSRETLEEVSCKPALRVLAMPLEDPGRALAAPPPPEGYRVLASDGSSVDVDPHFPARYVLLHTALAGLAYGPPAYWTEHVPRLFFRREELELAYPGSEEPVEVEGPVVVTLRAYEELRALGEGVGRLLQSPDDRPLLAMMDAVILWTHHGSGPGHEALREDYLRRSVEQVDRFRKWGVPLVSFTSMPRHREVVNTLLALGCPQERKLACSDCREPRRECLFLQGLQDRHLFSFLKEGERSALFRPVYRGDTAWRLPPGVQPFDPELVFFYLNTGPEVARVEMPLWIFRDNLLPTVHAVLLDQCRPRRADTVGYPLALTLAHREAVLTAQDRRFIQWLVEEALARRGLYLPPSAKAEMKE
ncbi:MAG: DNA double-strand break repair nuclease NurA [Chloroflexia bacterium]